MILLFILGVAATALGAFAPSSDLLPPDFPSPEPQIPSESEDTARLRGLYVPDNLEKRFDDGSDKSPPAPVPLANSPYGLVPAGSGLEGQHVADNLEKRFDDGSDKSQPPPVPLANSPYGPVPAGSGLEGQYVADNLEQRYDKGLFVPDNIEKRFDDGSDKSPPAPIPLANSPYGPVPAGSGPEGQYVADNLEKRFDDGSDKSQAVLVQSPYGLVKAGSGLEGQYVDSKIEKQFDGGQYVDTNLEKRFDDGLYKGETSAQPNLIDTPLGSVPAGSGLEGQDFPDGREKLFDDGLYRYGGSSGGSNIHGGASRGLVVAGVGSIPSK